MLDVPVGQKAMLRFRVKLLLGLLVEIVIVVTGQENILRHAMMVFSISMGKQIVGNPNLLKSFQETEVKPLKQLAMKRP